MLFLYMLNTQIYRAILPKYLHIIMSIKYTRLERNYDFCMLAVMNTFL